MVELLVQLYGQLLEVQRLKSRIDDDRTGLATLQFLHDRNVVEMNRLRDETRASYPAVVEKYTSDLPSMEEIQETTRTWIEEGEASLEQATIAVGQTWPQVYELSQKYFNRCLDANFEELWSMHRNACINMRQRLVDPHILVAQSRRDIHRLKYRLVLVGSEKRGLTLRLASAVRSEASRNDTAARIAELSEEERAIQSELFPEQAVLALRDDKLQQSQVNAGRDLLRPFLEAIGRLPRARDGSDVGDDVPETDDSRGNDEQEGVVVQRSSTRPGLESNTATSPIPRTPAEPVREQSSSEELIQAYLTACTDLETLQRRLGAEQLSFRGPFKEVDHILTFSNMSPERYAAYVAKCTREGNALQTAAEARVENTREALIAAGGEIPPEPARS